MTSKDQITSLRMKTAAILLCLAGATGAALGQANPSGTTSPKNEGILVAAATPANSNETADASAPARVNQISSARVKLAKYVRRQR